MDLLIKETLNYSYVKKTNIRGGGCINNGEAFNTDKGTIFVKYNSKSEVSSFHFNMFLTNNYIPNRTIYYL